MSVVVHRSFPFTMTVAPATGPALSTTFPSIFSAFASAKTAACAADGSFASAGKVPVNAIPATQTDIISVF